MQALLERARGILLSPAAEWQTIEREPRNVGLLLLYVAILALVPALARFVGWSLIGGSTPVLTGLVGALVGYVLAFVVVYLVAVIVNVLAPRYSAQPSFSNALKLTVYAHTPAW